jgi:hypothetical protein
LLVLLFFLLTGFLGSVKSLGEKHLVPIGDDCPDSIALS